MESGLFFTVQIGSYEQSDVDLQAIYGLSSYSVPTSTGGKRYLYGTFSSLSEAGAAREVAIGRGITDAFVTAYFQGKRITIDEAEKLLLVYGKIILQPE